MKIKILRTINKYYVSFSFIILIAFSHTASANNNLYDIKKSTPVDLTVLDNVALKSADKALQDYTKQCSSLIGAPMPSFSCFDGVEIPIVKTGGHSDCENPSLLGAGKCVTGQRIGNITIPNKPNIQIAFICRKYGDDEARHKFNDIAVIQHNKSTGATCWYQSETNDYRDGTHVASPAKGTNNGFWLAPSKSEGRIGTIKCASCHLADPFLHTPFLSQAGKIVPENPKGKYWNYLFPSWDNVKIVRFKQPSSNSCTNCHRIPISGNSCSKYNKNSVGLSSEKIWMPPNASSAALQRSQQEYYELQDCCSNGTACDKVSFLRKDPATIKILQIKPITKRNIHLNNLQLKAAVSNSYDLSKPIVWMAKFVGTHGRPNIRIGTSQNNKPLEVSVSCKKLQPRMLITAQVTLHDGSTIRHRKEINCPDPTPWNVIRDPFQLTFPDNRLQILNEHLIQSPINITP